MNMLQSLRGVAWMSAAEGMRSEGIAGSLFGGLGVTLNMIFFSCCSAATPSLLNEGVAAVRRLADRGKEESRRAQGRPTHSHHQMQVWNTCLTDTRTTFKYHGLLNPITGNQ